MKQQDKIIKDALYSKMEKLDSPGFTEKIVNQHLKTKTEKKKYAAFDFTSLIAGLVFIIISLGAGILVNADKIKGLTFEHLLIVMSLVVVFMIFRLLNEITAPDRLYMPCRRASDMHGRQL